MNPRDHQPLPPCIGITSLYCHHQVLYVGARGLNSGLQAGTASALTMGDFERHVQGKRRSAEVGGSRFKAGVQSQDGGNGLVMKSGGV